MRSNSQGKMVMLSRTVRNVNDAYFDMLWWIRAEGRREDSRNGPLRVMPGPVLTIYQRPWERVLFDKDRDANPFFHLAECVWLLAGSESLHWIKYFNSKMSSFSDDGHTLKGAYGYRWRMAFGCDQLLTVINMLQRAPR